MIICECIEKFRDKHNLIVGYRLRDSEGQIVDMWAAELKSAIKESRISVVNLELKKDGRLVDIMSKETKSIRNKGSAEYAAKEAMVEGLLKVINKNCGKYKNAEVFRRTQTGVVRISTSMHVIAKVSYGGGIDRYGWVGIGFEVDAVGEKAICYIRATQPKKVRILGTVRCGHIEEDLNTIYNTYAVFRFIRCNSLLNRLLGRNSDKTYSPEDLEVICRSLDKNDKKNTINGVYTG